VLAVVALGCVIFQLRMPSRTVAEADYQAAAQVVDAEAQPGDVVLLNPWWTERARIYLPERIPVVGYLDSNQDPLELHPRIWVLSQPRMGPALVTANTPAGPARAFGNLELQLYENRQYRSPRWDARAALAGAKVFFENAQGARGECRWDGRAHRCPNGTEVVTEFHEVKAQPLQCIKFFPPGGDAKLVAEFSNVPAAGSLALRAGLIWDRGWFKMPELTPVELGVEINGNAAGSLTIPVGVEGLLRLEGPPVPADATVRLWSRSRNPAHREVCLELFGLEKSRE
jgi:hypothetical protein